MEKETMKKEKQLPEGGQSEKHCDTSKDNNNEIGDVDSDFSEDVEHAFNYLSGKYSTHTHAVIVLTSDFNDGESKVLASGNRFAVINAIAELLRHPKTANFVKIAIDIVAGETREQAERIAKDTGRQ